MTERMKEFKEKCRKNQKEVIETDYKTHDEKMEFCVRFFEKLRDILKDNYEIVESCNKDVSKYLIPKGTKEEITYYGKPALSFRVSDHWNWYANVKKCEDLTYVQCRSMDIPWARKREDERATEPRRGCQVAIQGTDGKYHHVFGEKFDRKTKQWSWTEADPMDICKAYGLVV